MMLFAFAFLSTQVVSPSADEVVDREAAAYCDYTRAVATAKSTANMWPQLFSSVGWVHDGTLLSGTDVPLDPRLLVGLKFSVSDAWKSYVLQEQAQSDCAHYRATALLHAFGAQNQTSLSIAGASARLAILLGALPEAETMVQSARAGLTRGEQTLAELHGLELQLATLQDSIAQAQQEKLRGPRHLAAARVKQAMHAVSALAAAAESQSGRMRAADTWDVVVRGGYEHIWHTSTQLPLFGSIMVSTSFGFWEQGSKNRAAESARQRWEEARAGASEPLASGVTDTITALYHQLRERLPKLRERQALFAERLQLLRDVHAREGMRLLPSVWFDELSVRAEIAYVEARLSELETFAQEG